MRMSIIVLTSIARAIELEHANIVLCVTAAGACHTGHGAGEAISLSYCCVILLLSNILYCADTIRARTGAVWRAATRCRAGQRAARQIGSRATLQDPCQVFPALCRVCQGLAARRALGRMARQHPGLETLEGCGRGAQVSRAAQALRMWASWGVQVGWAHRRGQPWGGGCGQAWRV